MPRAFLITHRRYNGAEELKDIRNECKLNDQVHLAEYSNGQPTSDGASDCGSETSSECPEELYNLTKLAEVSLAAAAGTLNHPSSNLYQQQTLPPPTFCKFRSTRNEESRYKLNDKSQIFFEGIERDREILEEKKHLSRSDGYNQDFDTRISVMNSDSSSSSSSLSSSSSATIITNDGKNEETEDHECPDCGKKYSTSSNLARHRQTHRSLGDKKARKCPHCDKVYVSIPAFSMHVRTHNQGCKCHYCGKCFSRPWLLQGHIRTHTGEKPFKCTICNKAFADKSNLRAHIQTHSNTKPHICGRCGKAFALKSYLYKHEESSCMRTYQKSFTEKRQNNNEKTNSTNTKSCIRSSPTSVIVQRNTAFSAIIKHNKSSLNLSNPKMDGYKMEDKQNVLSTMVIRTSVISPNPEHLCHRNDMNLKSSYQINKSSNKQTRFNVAIA